MARYDLIALEQNIVAKMILARTETVNGAVSMVVRSA
jgi:hypothetical protein